MQLFEFDDYKSFLRFQIKENASTKGYQTLLAQGAGCQKAYLSQVLNGKSQLTLEHGAGMCEFWSFDQIKTDYFLLLINYARAGTPALKKLMSHRILELQAQTLDLSKQFNEPKLNETETMQTYYSTWTFAAIHMAVTIPTLQSSSSIASKLNLPKDYVDAGLKQLSQMGLIQWKNSRWIPTEKSIHLPRSSQLAQINDMHWRNKAVQKLQMPKESAIHYTAIHTMSLKDVKKFEILLRDFIHKSRELVKPSPEEELVCFLCDFFVI